MSREASKKLDRCRAARLRVVDVVRYGEEEGHGERRVRQVREDRVRRELGLVRALNPPLSQIRV
jgi:hypothetical protein